MQDIILSKLVKSESNLTTDQIKHVLNGRMEKETSFELVSETNNSLEVKYKDKLKFTNLTAHFSFKTDGKRAKIDVNTKQKISGKAQIFIVINAAFLITGLLALLGIIGFIFLLVKIYGSSKENSKNLEEIMNYVQTELDFGLIESFD
ncbi:hypothetical protein [Sporosarcina sp. BP05]|uniref:hypothetical protein n=1 Tax=Sporosarcina sp. BP05 TaxID=2758726 RepID=UPI0016471699|nr:hypothetical protein [Sporosarcina sp. BP05]